MCCNSSDDKQILLEYMYILKKKNQWELLILLKEAEKKNQPIPWKKRKPHKMFSGIRADHTTWFIISKLVGCLERKSKADYKNEIYIFLTEK